ncbi:lipoprotein [Metakosakonia massiliensis]|uniref:Lipoprotein n=1 Tax=Phytobacter massiliensis TaxID=1485952 RepID=A0A6N3HH17_9ENTR|nr:lipoprotein YedD [Phytobacter massiliensis]
MKKQLIFGAALLLSGCAQIDNYASVVRHPAPASLAGNWQSVGPQSELVSPEAIASLIVTPEGDTLDCRQWQRVIAVPGKLTLRGDDYYNVTEQRDSYQLEREGQTLEYDGMTLRRVDKPTAECADALAKKKQVGTKL